MNDPYKILGVAANASDSEIKKAYRKLSKKYHPDSNVGSPHLEEYTEMFKQIQNAYDQIMQQRKGGSSFQQSFQSHYYSSSNNQQSDTDFQAATNYINMNYFQEAYQVLNRMDVSKRNAHWYFLMGISLWGLRNPIAATENIKKACEMNPQNNEYRQVFAQMQSGRTFYQNMSSPFGTVATCNPSNICCGFMLMNLCCGSRFIYSPFLCC